MVVGRLIIVLVTLFLVACSEEIKVNQLYFSPIYQGESFNCSSSLNIDGVNWELSQLQFFLSNVQLLNVNNQWQPAQLEINPHQTENLTLLGQNCAELDIQQWQLTFVDSINLKKFSAIRFSLGVPFEVNHLNPLTQKSPLNDSSMFWVWQTGHKFMRLEMESGDEDWLFHLGSTGCKSASVMRPPNNACLQPNLFTFEASLTSQEIVFDLNKLFNGLALTNDTSCQSAPNDKSCQQLFENMETNQKNSLFRALNEK